MVCRVPRFLLVPCSWDETIHKKEKKTLFHQRSLKSLEMTDTAYPATDSRSSKPLHLQTTPLQGPPDSVDSAWGEKPSDALKGWGCTNVQTGHTGQQLQLILRSLKGKFGLFFCGHVKYIWTFPHWHRVQVHLKHISSRTVHFKGGASCFLYMTFLHFHLPCWES